MLNQLFRQSGTKLIAVVAVLLFLGVSSFSKAETVLITGSNSGIGLEFSQQYAARGWTVIATHRRDEVPETLAKLKSKYGDNVRIEKMDVSSKEQVFGLAEKLEGVPIDVLINNAGIFCFCDWMDESYKGQAFGSLEFDNFKTIMLVNARGVAMVSEAFAGNVKASEQKKIITMTSLLGSMSNPESGLDAMWYAASKAAVNRLNVAMAETLREDNVIVVPMHPGSVAVEKQEEVEDLPQVLKPSESIRQMIETIDNLDMSHSGRFLRYDGEELPW